MPIIVIVLGLAIIALGSYLIINRDNPDDCITTNDCIVFKEEATTTNISNNYTTSTTETTETEINTSEPIVATSTEPVQKNNPSTTSPTPTKPTEKPVTQTTKTYTAEETYRKSDNIYTIDVTLDVSNGVVKNADVMYGNKETGYQHPFQERFDAVYKTEVIGKKLEDIHLSRVGGASLTSKAFNEAVANIISQTTQS